MLEYNVITKWLAILDISSYANHITIPAILYLIPIQDGVSLLIYKFYRFHIQA